MQKSYSLSLSRWHTVANRMKSHAEGLIEHAEQVLNYTVVQHELNAGQQEALRERGQQALKDIAHARLLLQAHGTVRAMLAQANGERGVSAKLAQAEAMRKELQVLSSLARVDLLNKVALEDVNNILSKRAGDHITARSGVAVSLVGLNALEHCAKEKAALERQMNDVLDEVNTLNRHTLSIELDEAVGELVGA